MTKALLVLAVAAFALAGCPKKEQNASKPAKAEPAKAEPAKAEPAKAEPAKAEPAKAEPAKAEPAKADEAITAEGDPEKDCGALHDFIKTMKEQLTKKLGKGKETKPLPPKAKFVEACKALPKDMVRCMNPKTQMAEPQKCKDVLTKAKKENQAALEKFKSLMK